ncbi:hypothetical protein CFB44_14090 [Burkholderia sp. AU31280]|nr:hypothetical protein CFB44_14090 [Burkholderia sp. AU31280]RQV18165.1 hypothetical protein DF132_23305 [Burkholderia cenocepacia]RQV57049.1 hypothetical protein DF024_27835 [Burkholderia cenocepacia]RQV63184.1 hypothetical protein DF018_25855 [Burkholderia cenocepacia]RQZ91481.1 hypothetical protein DF058_23970 [Burkholderia cenocepacia]
MLAAQRGKAGGGTASAGRLPPAMEAGTGRRQLFSGKMEKGIDSRPADRHNLGLRRISSVG